MSDEETVPQPSTASLDEPGSRPNLSAFKPLNAYQRSIKPLSIGWVRIEYHFPSGARVVVNTDGQLGQITMVDGGYALDPPLRPENFNRLAEQLVAHLRSQTGEPAAAEPRELLRQALQLGKIVRDRYFPGSRRTTGSRILHVRYPNDLAASITVSDSQIGQVNYVEFVRDGLSDLTHHYVAKFSDRFEMRREGPLEYVAARLLEIARAPGVSAAQTVQQRRKTRAANH